MKRLVLLTLALLVLSLQPAAATMVVSAGDDSGNSFSRSGHFGGFGTSFLVAESSAPFAADTGAGESFGSETIRARFLAKARFRHAILSHAQVSDLRASLWGWSGHSNIRAGRFGRDVVPEPSTGLLLGLGIAGLARRHRSR